MLTGAAAGAADGGVSGGLSYATSGRPLSVTGFAEATGEGAAFGGATGGLAGGALTKVAGSACFVAGTQVLMGDGSSKNIEDIRIGDEVTAADPDTGETHAKRVIDTYVHPDVPTHQVETTAGTVTSTEEHPFYVHGKGWTPVRELQQGDQLVDPKGSAVEVISIQATGQTATVYNINVDDLHTYHVQTDGDAWIRVHNRCTIDSDKIDDVINETTSHTGRRDFTSVHSLNPDEALEGGQKWVGEGYREIGQPGSGVFRSADGLRQFRMDNGSITGAHPPAPGHVHFEIYPPARGDRPSITTCHWICPEDDLEVRRDARFTAGEYDGSYLVAKSDESGSIIALVCEGTPGNLRVVADYWFKDADDLVAGVTEGDWNVEWLPSGSLGEPA